MTPNLLAIFLTPLVLRSLESGHDSGRTDKLRYRLTVNVAERDPALAKWTEWAATHVTPVTIRSLHDVASGFDSWYVYFGVIDPANIAAFVDMQTGLVMEDWRSTPQGDVRPVPPMCGTRS